MNPLALTWLRRIALGLPHVAATPLAGCYCATPCPQPPARTFSITEEQRAMIAGEVAVADGGVQTCAELCEQLLEDDYYSLRTECEIEGSGDDSLLHCTYQNICPGGRRPAGLLAASGAPRHALLSLALDGWAKSRLSAREARAIDERRRESVLALSRELEAEPAPALRAALGMPDAERSVAMARALV